MGCSGMVGPPSLLLRPEAAAGWGTLVGTLWRPFPHVLCLLAGAHPPDGLSPDIMGCSAGPELLGGQAVGRSGTRPGDPKWCPAGPGRLVGSPVSSLSSSPALLLLLSPLSPLPALFLVCSFPSPLFLALE